MGAGLLLSTTEDMGFEGLGDENAPSTCGELGPPSPEYFEYSFPLVVLVPIAVCGNAGGEYNVGVGKILGLLRWGFIWGRGESSGAFVLVAVVGRSDGLLPSPLCVASWNLENESSTGDPSTARRDA